MHDGKDDDDIDLDDYYYYLFIFAIYATFYSRGNTGLILSQASSVKNRS